MSGSGGAIHTPRMQLEAAFEDEVAEIGANYRAECEAARRKGEERLRLHHARRRHLLALIATAAGLTVGQKQNGR